ncbi:MAG: hypothetical protein J0I43_00035 [Microbacterium sp.]|uniref:hypothetical protein n=1 Tax=Microbacterium sp. TaxID=51671 RepID=UPI001AD4B140|nr:hypothetical protein [Microbacterium sp.]MBN9175748.1 hypothetical protein [Microbacterium sp.]
MSPDRQTQRAGENSTQVQATTVVINQGISEERVHEIMRVERERLKQEFEVEARAVIDVRLEALDARLLPALAEGDDLGEFANPAFVRAYRKAQNGAAASERESDYDMLAGLLKERADRSTERPTIAGIEKAIEIVDLVDDDALRGITVLQAVFTLSPNSHLAFKGLDAMETLFAQLLDGPLPEGADWMDHLDVLNAVRVTSGSDFRPFDEYYTERLHGYACPGILAENVPATLSPPYEHVTWGDSLIDHEFKPGFKRIGASNERTMRYLMGLNGVDDAQIEATVSEANSAMGFAGTDAEAITGFIAALDQRPSLSAIRAWWGRIPSHLAITAVGKTLARANAYRLDVSGSYPRD